MFLSKLFTVACYSEKKPKNNTNLILSDSVLRFLRKLTEQLLVHIWPYIISFSSQNSLCKKEKKKALQNTVSKHVLMVEHQQNKTHITIADTNTTIYLFGKFETKDKRKGLTFHVKWH